MEVMLRGIAIAQLWVAVVSEEEAQVQTYTTACWRLRAKHGVEITLEHGDTKTSDWVGITCLVWILASFTLAENKKIKALTF